jgi:hypothetical protein
MVKKLYYKYISSESSKFPFNVNAQEFKELERLRGDTSISIVKSDKSNSLVVLDRINYLQLGYSFFDNNGFSKIGKDDTVQNYNKLNKILYNLKKQNKISQDEYLQMKPQSMRTACAYVLPKTHKKDYKQNLKCRPIVSSVGSFNYSLAQYLASRLKGKLENYSKSSSDFVNNLLVSTFSEDNLKMISLDVENMYPSIPIDKAIELASNLLLQDENCMLSKAELKQLFELCTKCSSFRFGEFYFKQNNGVSMGSPLAPILAEIYMRSIEEKIFNAEKLFFYYRYVDDCFVIIKESVNLESFLASLNTIDQHIKFSLEDERNCRLNFLDVIVDRNRNNFETSWYTKPERPQKFTSYKTFSSKRYKMNLITCMVNKIYSICSNRLNLEKSLDKLKVFLLNSDFPKSLVDFKIKSVLQKIENNKNQLAQVKPPVSERKIFFGVNYSGLKSEIFMSKLKKLFCKQYNENMRMITYFKSSSNLASIFKHTYKFPGEHTNPGVYQISCHDCDRKYVGETFRSIKIRAKEHFSYIGKTGGSAISQHVEQTAHRVNFEETRMVYSQSNLIKRKIAEALIIKDTKTVENNMTSVPLLVFG